MNMHQGIFISFEGVDGVGKTTQVNRLRDELEAMGREVVVTREPGGTALGTAIRRLLLHGVPAESADGEACADIAPRTEALLFAADRAQHVAEVIRPALERGAVVITDRYCDSSLAYQAGGRELTAAEIRSLSMWATDGLLPVRTYLLDMDPALSHTRLDHDEDRMEAAGSTFQRRTRQAFLDLAAREPNRFRVIDASGTVEEVWQAIREDFVGLL
ncbi:MAG: dTMP kinase [Bifidobacterium angulatum]